MTDDNWLELNHHIVWSSLGILKWSHGGCEVGLVLGKELRGQWVEHSEQKSYEQSGSHYPALQSTQGCIILRTVENIGGF